MLGGELTGYHSNSRESVLDGNRVGVAYRIVGYIEIDSERTLKLGNRIQMLFRQCPPHVYTLSAISRSLTSVQIYVPLLANIHFLSLFPNNGSHGSQ